MGYEPFPPAINPDWWKPKKPRDPRSVERDRLKTLTKSELRKKARLYPFSEAANMNGVTSLNNEIALRVDRSTHIMTKGFNQNEIDVIRNSICKDASPMELSLFLNVCKASGLDPLKPNPDVYLIPGQGGKKPCISVDGLISTIANKNPRFRCIVGPHWTADGEKWLDVWLKDEPPAAARAGVVLDGVSEPIYAVCVWKEYADYHSRQNSIWQKMPAHMLGKNAIKQAIRKACPSVLEQIREVGAIVEDDEPSLASVVQPVDAEYAEFTDSPGVDVERGMETESSQPKPQADIPAPHPLAVARQSLKDTGREVGREIYYAVIGDNKVETLTVDEIRLLESEMRKRKQASDDWAVEAESESVTVVSESGVEVEELPLTDQEIVDRDRLLERRDQLLNMLADDLGLVTRDVKGWLKKAGFDATTVMELGLSELEKAIEMASQQIAEKAVA